MKPTAARLARLDAYVDGCVALYVEAGASDQQIQELVTALRCEGAPDWMPYEEAQSHIAANSLGQEVDKDTFLLAHRTSVTATRSERARFLARYIGVDHKVALKYVDQYDEGDAFEMPATPDQCALYRHYDEDGVLLYVGITNDPDARAQQHCKSSPWAKFSSRVEVEWLEDREAAADAERAAIADELPIFNKANNASARNAAVEYLLAKVEAA